MRVLGTPSERSWPQMSKLPDYNKITFPSNPPMLLGNVVPDATDDAVELLSKFLIYDSTKVRL